MKIDFSRTARLLGVAAIVFVTGRSASASLFATFNLNQGVYEYGSPFSSSFQSTPFGDTTVPLNMSVTQNTATNGITTTYSAYDSGGAAGFGINSSAYIGAAENQVGEEAGLVPNQGLYTTFSFTQAVNYTISDQVTGSHPGGELLVYSPTHLLVDDGQMYPFSQSGTMQPNLIYEMAQNWAISNQANSGPANEAGTDSLTFTFTAIPEPSSLSLLMLPAALLARRRKRGSSVRG